MSLNDQHPWTPERWLTEQLYGEMLKDWPEADKEYLFKESLTTVQNAWENKIPDKKKKRFIKLAKKDEKKSEKAAKNSSEDANVKIEFKSPVTVQTRKKKAPTSDVQPSVEPKKKKLVKDPLAPKKPLSAFFVFNNEKKDSIKAANPDFKVVDVAKELGRQWQELNDEQKAPYKKEAEERKKQYEEDLAEYMKKKETDG